MGFTLETHYQPGRELINSGIPSDCPLCGKKELRCYRIRILDFEILRCDSCKFVGDLLLLHSLAHEESIAKVAFDYDGDRSELKFARELMEGQEKMHDLLKRSREKYPSSEGQISAILDEWSPAVNIGRNPPFSKQMYLLDEELLSGEEWLPEVVLKKESYCVAVPFFVLPGLISQITFIGCRITHHRTSFRSESLADQEEGGCIDLSGPDQDSVLVMTDLFEAVRLSRLFCSTSLSSGCPIVVVDPEKSRAVWDTMEKDEMILLVGDEFPPVAYELISRPGITFTHATAAELSSRIRACGSGGLLPAAREDAGPFRRLVRGLAASEERELLEGIDETSVPGPVLSRVIDEATGREVDVLEEVWPGLSRGGTVYWKQMSYKRLPEGGIRGRHRSTGREEEVSDIDFRIDRYLRGPEGLFLAGRLRHRSQDIPLKVPMDMPDGRMEAEVLQAPSMQRKMSPVPRIYSSTKKWKRLCLQLSGEVGVEDGAGRSGLHGDQFILPGWVVTAGDIQERDLIARRTSCRWRLYCRPRRYLSQILEDTTGAALAWAGILGLSVPLCSSLFGREPGPVILTGRGGQNPLLKELSESLFLPDEPELPGYPFVSDRADGPSLSAMDPMDAHVCGLVGNPHYVIAGGSEPTGMQSAGWVLLRIIQHGLRRPALLRVEGSCSCEMLADLAESYVSEQLGASVRPVRKGARMIRCGSLLRRGWPGSRSGAIAGFVSMCLALSEREGTSRFVSAGEEKVRVHLRELYDTIRPIIERRTEGISDGQVAQRLLREEGVLGAAGEDLLLRRDLWDEIEDRWKTDCRELFR